MLRGSVTRNAVLLCMAMTVAGAEACQTLSNKEKGGAIIGHQMDQKAREIQATVAGAEVTRVGEGLVVTFNSGLMFDFDPDVLRAESRTNLDNLASNLSSFADSKLMLVGHTDDKGTAAYSQRHGTRTPAESTRGGCDLRQRPHEGRGEGAGRHAVIGAP
jgi:outer membrane protein OmpA-like peptidoglycan-associated protein